MSPLAAAILALLESERDYPPLSVETICRVMHVTGQELEPAIPVVESALLELMQGGQAERLHRRGAAAYRILRSVQAGNAGGS